MDWAEHVWLLCLWWACWSLLDAYALRFSPWSELAMLVCCAGAFAAWRAPAYVRAAREGMSAALEGVSAALDKVTQTGVPRERKPERAYDRQDDSV